MVSGETAHMIPSVTIFIPTWNAGPEFADVLDSVLTQDYEGDFELTVVDSSSNDGFTHEALASRHVPFEVIPQETFNHGQTRNRVAKESQSEVIVFLSQDAKPRNDQWLAELIAPMKNSPTVACFSAQEPRQSCHPFQLINVQRHMKKSMACELRLPLSPEEYAGLSPLARVERIRFDNVSSAIYRQSLMNHPFEPTMFGEDLIWARSYLLSGGSIAFCPASIVSHSHDVTWKEFYSRVSSVHQTLRTLCDFVPIDTRYMQLRRSAGTCFRFWKSCLTAGKSSWALRFWGLLAAPFWAFLQMEGMYRGGRKCSYVEPKISAVDTT